MVDFVDKDKRIMCTNPRKGWDKSEVSKLYSGSQSLMRKHGICLGYSHSPKPEYRFNPGRNH